MSENTDTTSLRLYDHRDLFIDIVGENRTRAIEEAIDRRMEDEGIDPGLWGQIVSYLLNRGYDRDELANVDDPTEVVKLYRDEMTSEVDDIIGDT